MAGRFRFDKNPSCETGSTMSHTLPHTPEIHEEPDPWHRHTVEEGVPQAEHAATVNVPILMGVFVATVVFVSATILFTVLYFQRYVTDLRQERIETTVMGQGARDYKDAALSQLNRYGWVDPQAGTVSLPLEVARARVIGAYGTR
jgi:hypothetical protein